MKSKEEILSQYYSHGPDGLTEITADGLLKAMEEYRLQAEEAAFNAAREYEDDIIGGKHSFKTFEDYKASLAVPGQLPAEPSEPETIKFMADSILEQFIPKEADRQKLSFDIRTNGLEYRVDYEKSIQGYWNFTGYRLNS